jgi:hypothetical protein
MPTFQTTARRAPHHKEDLTTFDLRPWHAASEGVEVDVDLEAEDVTAIGTALAEAG